MRENLGNVYFRQGQLDKTAKNLEVVLAMRRKALGDDSEPVARTLANIGTVYKRAGNDEAAVKNYREAVERLSAKLGPEHPDVGTILGGMGDSLRKLEKYSEAEAALKRALDINVKALGEGNAANQRTIKCARHSLYRVEEARGGRRVHGEAEAGRGEGASGRGEVAEPRITSPQVNTRPLHRVGLGLAQHFAGHRRRVAFAEGEELQQIGDGIAFGPAEVRVRDGPGFVADI